MSDFFNKSKEIANDFLQSIVFLDDKAFKDGGNQHAFDAFEVSKAFAMEKKVCAVYSPKTKEDIDNFTSISQKADVVVLDWWIYFQNIESDPNADADSEDPRGQYTIEIIKKITEYSAQNSLKLVIVFTGEDTLDDITNRVYSNIIQIDNTFIKVENNCEVSSSNVKILVRHKSIDIEKDKQKFNNRPHLQDKLISYANLPDFILIEFTKMTEGLLSNFALLSLSTIRNNSHKILGLFSKELDAAYLGHKVVLPIQSDSEDLLVKLFGDTISDLLNYTSIPQKIQTELIDNWIDNNIHDEPFSINTKHFQRTKAALKHLIHSEKEKIEERFNDAFVGNNLSNNEKKSYETNLFLNLVHQGKKDEINSKFAKLTHHKSLFLPQSTAPKLTLGTVVRSVANQDNFYICIQQRCDSVRLKKDEVRKFLFLPLSKVENDKFHIITPNDDKLKLDIKSYSIKTIKFKCNCNEGEIKGELLENGTFIFKEDYEDGNTFEWVLDLKDMRSQKIVIDYISELSRIGLDESEWLRTAGN